MNVKGWLDKTKYYAKNNFRTYEENGLLVYHTFSSEGFVKLFMEDARIKVLIVSQDMPDVELDNFDQVWPNFFVLIAVSNP